MSTDHITITFNCVKCGGTVLSLPDNYTDDSIATCKSCGADVGRFGDIKSKAAESAKAEVERTIKDTLRGTKGVNFKGWSKE